MWAWFYRGERNLYNTKRPIHTPSDMKASRIRVPQNIVSIDIVKVMGASAASRASTC